MARRDFIRLIGVFMTSYGLLRVVEGHLTGLSPIFFGIIVMAVVVITERDEL